MSNGSAPVRQSAQTIASLGHALPGWQLAWIVSGTTRSLPHCVARKQTEITELQQQNAELLKRLEAIEVRLH